MQDTGHFGSAAIRLRPARAGERVYRITPWAIRVGAPLVALVWVGGAIQSGGAALLLSPVVVAFCAWWLVGSELCGLYVTDFGIESRMSRRANSFRYSWANVDEFDLVDNGAQLAIVVGLTDGTRRLLPSTKVWAYQRRALERLLSELTRELDCSRRRGVVARSR